MDMSFCQMGQLILNVLNGGKALKLLNSVD